MATIQARVTLANSGGALDTVLVTCEADMSRAIGDAVVELIRQSGGMLCIGDRISIDEAGESGA